MNYEHTKVNIKRQEMQNDGSKSESNQAYIQMHRKKGNTHICLDYLVSSLFFFQAFKAGAGEIDNTGKEFENF